MEIQAQPDYLIFAQDSKTGELLDFPNVARGWGLTIDQTQSKPPLEWMNGAFNRVDKNILYLLQQGVPEWNNAVLYPTGAVIKYKNIIYIAAVQNDNAIPSTNTTKWSKLIDDASTSKKGIVQLNSAINSTAENQAATPKAVKTACDLAASKLSSDNFTASLNGNGYQKLSSGLIIQWGIYSNSIPAVNTTTAPTITFPTTFPNKCFVVSAQSNDGINMFYDCCIFDIKNASFRAGSGGSAFLYGLRWLAIGY